MVNITFMVILFPDNVLRKLFRFVDLRKSDIFYDLGCGSSSAVAIAAEEFKVKRSIGIEIRRKIAIEARKKIVSMNNAEIIIGDIRKAAISDATVLFFWFTDPKVIEPMVGRFQKELKSGARVITILAPPDLMLPIKTKFPFFVFQKPFKYAKEIQEQIEAIFGKPCIDFVDSWLIAEKYIDELGGRSRRTQEICEYVSKHGDMDKRMEYRNSLRTRNSSTCVLVPRNT